MNPRANNKPMSNYSPSQSDSRKPQTGAVDIAVFEQWSTTRRLNRLQYFVLSFGLPLFVILSLLFASPLLKRALFDPSGSASLNAVLVVMAFVSLLLVVLFVQVMWAVRRCYDMDRSPWMSALLFVPIVNLPFWLLPGTSGNNQYGPEPHSTVFWRTAAISLAALYAATLTTLTLMAKAGYEDRITRYQVAQCLKSSRDARLTLSHHLQDRGRFIDKESARVLFNLNGIESKFCTQTLDVEHKFITAQFNSDDSLSPSLHEATVFFVQRPERTDAHEHDVLFRCVSDDIAKKHLPRRCAL